VIALLKEHRSSRMSIVGDASGIGRCIMSVGQQGPGDQGRLPEDVCERIVAEVRFTRSRPIERPLFFLGSDAEAEYGADMQLCEWLG
jgi:hypothetical protein